MKRSVWPNAEVAAVCISPPSASPIRRRQSGPEPLWMTLSARDTKHTYCTVPLPWLEVDVLCTCHPPYCILVPSVFARPVSLDTAKRKRWWSPSILPHPPQLNHAASRHHPNSRKTHLPTYPRPRTTDTSDRHSLLRAGRIISHLSRPAAATAHSRALHLGHRLWVCGALNHLLPTGRTALARALASHTRTAHPLRIVKGSHPRLPRGLFAIDLALTSTVATPLRSGLRSCLGAGERIPRVQQHHPLWPRARVTLAECSKHTRLQHPTNRPPLRLHSTRRELFL